MEKKSIIALIIAVLVAISGYFAVTVPNWGGNETTGSTVVSEQPIPLIIMDFAIKPGLPDALNRVPNFADQSNKGKINGTGWNITYVEADVPFVPYPQNISYLNMYDGTTTIIMQRKEYYPNRIDLNFKGALTNLGTQLEIVFGKEEYASLTINASKLLQPDLFQLMLNTVENGTIYINISPIVIENVSSGIFGGYFNFIVDPTTGDIAFQLRALDNCTQRDTAFYTNIGPFTFPTNSTGEVKVVTVNGGGFTEALITFGLFQNPLSGQYESLNEEYCRQLDWRGII